MDGKHVGLGAISCGEWKGRPHEPHVFNAIKYNKLNLFAFFVPSKEFWVNARVGAWNMCFK